MSYEIGLRSTKIRELSGHLTTIPNADIDNLTFQVPNNGLYSVIEIQLGITSEPDKCQMVSTFTRVGRTIGDPGHHGQAGGVLAIDAPITGDPGDPRTSARARAPTRDPDRRAVHSGELQRAEHRTRDGLTLE